jgi:hypothetical protein
VFLDVETDPRTTVFSTQTASKLSAEMHLKTTLQNRQNSMNCATKKAPWTVDFAVRFGNIKPPH